LHLTDLHFGWDRDASSKAERKLVLDGLIDQLIALPEDWRPQVVCISGDIAWRGKAEDYVLAEEWLTRLVGRLGVGFESVVACAGNHDVDRAVAERIARPSDAKTADEILRAPLAVHNLSTCAAFADFCTRVGIAPYTFQGEPSYLLGHATLKGLRFVALNSAWFCKDDRDKGNLWIGLPLIRLIESEGGLRLSEGAEAEPTVCLIHHPPDWWHEAEKNATEGRPNTLDYLAHRTHLILTGHTHGEVRKADRIAQGALHLTGGAGYSGSAHYNSYRLIRIEKKRLQFRSFEYDPRSAGRDWRGHGIQQLQFVEEALAESLVPRAESSLAADRDRLAALSLGPMDDVSTAVAGLPPVDRRDAIEAIETHLGEHGVCLVSGESGSGKSALAKMLGEAKYERVVWLTAENLDSPDDIHLGDNLGLQNSLDKVLASLDETCLVVIDGVEQCSGDALRQAARLTRVAYDHAKREQIRILLTLQLEATHRVVSRLRESGLGGDAVQPVLIPRLNDDAIRSVLQSVPTLSWVALRPECRDLLTNLKLLDWVVRAARDGFVFGEGQPLTLTSLVDRLWERWIEDDGLAYERSGLLMKVGELEAATLASGVQVTTLDFQEQKALPSLVAADLVRVREGRIRFAHDLLGDWARLRVLVSEGPRGFSEDEHRVASPRWHRAIRLLGQRLLEQGGSGGPEEWKKAIVRANDGTDAGQVVSDLLLEAIFFARDARSLLEQAWSLLTADRGRLLERLLMRFLYIATVPSEQLEQACNDQDELARVEHVFRRPFGPYWRGVLETLSARRQEVAEICPVAASRVARLWLRYVPPMLNDAVHFPWRSEAALVALAVARRFLRPDKYVSHDDEDEEIVYEAVLLAAPDFSEDVTALCREKAERLPRKGVSTDADLGTHRAGKAPATKRAACTHPVLQSGSLPRPWPDGPLRRVSDSFRTTCLDSGAFPVLFHTLPEVAVEVLLAVSIEEPKPEAPFFSLICDDCDVESWPGGYPPLYFRGPFLQMLRDNRDAALTYILKLVNFATRRFVEKEARRRSVDLDPKEPQAGIWIEQGGDRRCWLGDTRVYRWGHDSPQAQVLITCSLMALEYWLYEEIDKGTDLSSVFSRLLRESESLAFAGLLVDVGKRNPSLFVSDLRPLLASAPIYQLDMIAVTERRLANFALLPWRLTQPLEWAKMAEQWYSQDHRRELMRDYVQLLISTTPDLAAFLKVVVATWRAEIGGNPADDRRFLVEQLDPDNIVLSPLDNERVAISFTLPHTLKQEAEASSAQRDEEMLLMLLPVH
jgi:hypothetical protein